MDDKDPDRYILRVVMAMLAAIVGGELFMILGRGVMCALRGGCPFEELTSATEMLSGLLATLIALVFALTRGPPK